MASSLSQSPRGLNTKKKRRVRFHRDTILDDSDHIALTITRHSFIYDKGYTQYFIKVIFFYCLIYGGFLQLNIALLYFSCCAEGWNGRCTSVTETSTICTTS